MKQTLFAAALLLFLASCKKDYGPSEPAQEDSNATDYSTLPDCPKGQHWHGSLRSPIAPTCVANGCGIAGHP